MSSNPHRLISANAEADNTVRAILIVAPQWIGDAVMALSLIQAIARDEPATRLVVLATPWVAPVFEGTTALAQTLIFPAKRGALQWRARWRFARDVLRPLGFSRAFILPNSWKSALMPWMAGIPSRIGFWGEARWGLINRPVSMPSPKNSNTPIHQGYRYRLLYSSPDSSPDWAVPSFVLASEDGPRLAFNPPEGVPPPPLSDRPMVALCLGAEYGPAKQWPINHWSQLCQSLIGQGFSVCLIGTAKETPLQAQIINALNKAECEALIASVGQTTLIGAINLLQQSVAVFSNDSGLMHLAAALRKPLWAFFGSSDEKATHPLAHEGVPTTIMAAQDLSCRPCLARTCRFGHYACLNQLSVAQTLTSFHSVFPTGQRHTHLENPAESKKKLRSWCRPRRQAVMNELRDAINRSVAEKIDMLCRPWIDANPAITLGIYAAMQDEINLDILIQRWRTRGINVALPSLMDNTPTKKMVYRLWRQETVYEALPTINRGNNVWRMGDGDEVLPSILLIPCLGFNVHRYRLGYGAGFFDRYLAKCRAHHHHPITLGVSIEETRLLSNFAEPHDLPLSLIITPQNLYGEVGVNIEPAINT